MKEEIIIDGINVAGCEFYFEDNGVIAPDGTPERANLCTSPERSCENSDSCYCNKECYYKQLKRLEQERDEWKKKYEDVANENLKEIYELIKKNDCWRGIVSVVCSKLEQENKELSFAIEKCLENAGIECDDEEQALRSLPMLGNAHYKVLVEKEELEQENKELKEAKEQLKKWLDANLERQK